VHFEGAKSAITTDPAKAKVQGGGVDSYSPGSWATTAITFDEPEFRND